GLLGDSSSEEEDAAELAADSDQDEALVGEWGVGAMAANPDEHIPDSDETHRLAVVDLDWDKIRASIFGKTVVNGNEDKGAGSRLAARGRSMSDSESGEEHSEAEDAAELDAAVLEAAAELSDDSIEDGVQLQ
ncbi:MAG: pre-rRNA processing, partial [Trebouxia sp. A1-2]